VRKSLIYASLAATAFGFLSLAKEAGGTSATIESVKEISYPTEWQSQAIGDLDPDRPPIPSSFQVRKVGTSLTIDAIVSGGGVINVNAPLRYLVLFPNGMKAEFENDRTTVVGKTAYRGVRAEGFGFYIARDPRGKELPLRIISVK